jgi:hypothetical protein
MGERDPHGAGGEAGPQLRRVEPSVLAGAGLRSYAPFIGEPVAPRKPSRRPWTDV